MTGAVLPLLSKDLGLSKSELTLATGLVFVVALVVEGLCTSLMLIAAAPPLVTGWPVTRMPATGFVMNSKRVCPAHR